MYKFIVFIWVLSCFILFPFIAGSEDTQPFYTIGPTDILTIKVFDNSDFSGDFTVSPNGSIIYPVLGEIKVAGFTIEEIRNHIASLLEKDYLYNPVVSVTVKQYRSKSVSLFGNIGNPGTYYMDRPLRLFDLLTKADAISPQLGKIRKGQDIRIVRKASLGGDQKSEQTKTIHIDAYQLIVEGKKDANIYLQNGDLIYLPKISQIQVINGVKKPGIYPYEDNMTVLKAITLAGGTASNTMVNHAIVRRIIDGKEVNLKVKMDELLKPDDILEVPVEAIEEIYVMGEVNKPGTFPYERGITVLMAITKAGGATKRASVKNTVIKRIKDKKETKIPVQMGDVLQPGDIVEVPLSFW